ncbi:hypothetical protein EPUS_04615 [Endocarpon pusillum Z07020]|uniref:RNA polymerase I-specific transcription initiation factor RRN6-like protein n=1 Tax=Endocarpon pusillum (strain Z07020 / HMAS-L-300199) TaxID=1263415 RepID=U1HXU5_ENDPU|nr:uncharacterized protein EPUS_04615 [Endocarpon pusillum Z07020]ERF75635.1 hypothetical protein EPUS_04615 [Endocarpon pusillum Z07020]
MSQRQELQNAHSTKFLNYGHLGTVTYDEEDKSWETLRIIDPIVATVHTDAKKHGSTAFPLRRLSSKVVYAGRVVSQHGFQAESNDDNLDHINESSSAPTRESQPDARTEEKSRIIKGAQSDCTTFAENQSPNLSTLLAFGSAISAKADVVRSEYVHVPIAASVSGSNAQNVRLVRIGREVTKDPDVGGDAILHLPSISNEGKACWISNGGPIQQVRFAAANGYASTWMAARLQSSTTIFHPLLHRIPVAPRREPFQVPLQALQSSVLDANPIATIPLSRTGGHPHADFDFHPQDHRKFALIDEHGNWSVWLVDGEYQESTRSRFWVTLMCFGKIWSWDHEKRVRVSLPYHDGWHRILWCVHSETPADKLFICNRRTAARYTTWGDLIGLEHLRLGHSRENQYILDVQVSSFVPGYCFVLTSTQLFWLCFTETQDVKVGKERATPHVLLAWQHFRDRGDRTLHLVLLEAGLSTLVLIVSRLNNLVLVFRVGFADGHNDHPVSLADPLSIFLPGPHYSFESVGCPISQLFRSIECNREVQGSIETASPLLFKLFSLYEDFTIAEQLYASTEPSFGLTAGAAPLPLLHLPIQVSLGNLKSTSRRRRGFRDFVVPDDWVESNVSLTVAEGDAQFKDPRRNRLRTRVQPGVNWKDVYGQLTDEGSNAASKARISVGTLLSRFNDRSEKFNLPEIPLLSEMLSCKLHITDVDEDSEQLDELVATFILQQNRQQRLQRFPIITSEAQAINRLASIYDAIVATHLTPLAPQTPDRIRVNKERLARRVAADLLLASTAFYPDIAAPTPLVTHNTVAERETSQVMPSSSSAPSVLTPASPPTIPTATTSTASTEEDHPVLTRLRKYTAISTASPLVSTSISSLNNSTLSSILRHLPTSAHTNPETYNYRATERNLAAEAEEELALAAGQADPQARRRAEKAKLARLRKEEIRRKRAADEQMKSSQSRGPPRVMSTQVGGLEGVREVQSSQAGVASWDTPRDGGSSQGRGYAFGLSQEMPMTQPERGVFGMRPGMPGFAAGKKMDKGKKRAAGF